MGEDNDSHLTTASLQEVIESNNVSLEPPLLQTKQPQFSQPFPPKTCAPDPSQLHCPSLDTLQGLNVFLVIRGTKLNTVLKVQPHQS